MPPVLRWATNLVGERYQYWDDDDDDVTSEASEVSEPEDVVYPIERILCEIKDERDRSRSWFLVKWQRCPLLRSSWESESIFKDTPWVYDEWLVEKQKQEEGKSKPFDLDEHEARLKELEQAEKLNRHFRRLRRRYASLRLSAFTHVLSASTQDASHPADTDIICSPTNATDCYGRTFQPTEEFQLIREGQEIPPGLHVRLNVYTGEKEARLNIPTEEDERLAGLPIESSVVVVDQAANNVADERPAMRDRHPEQPPAYDAAGKVVPPKPSDDGAVGDAGNFREAVNLLENKVVTDEELDVALSHLLELAHDIFYGVELVKRSVSLKALTWLLFSESPSQRREAASILGGALQNNPTALREALGAWSTTPSNGTLIEVVLQTLEWENDSTAARAKVSVLAGLVKDVESRDAFLEKGGMRQLLASFMTEGQQWDNTRRKIAQFVMDTFLNEDMGAHLGVWPKDSQDVATDAACSSVHDLPESCWRYQIEKISTGRDTPEWAVEFERLLKLAAPSWWAKTSVPKMHDEL